MLSLTATPGSVQPGFLGRIGMLAGLPVQLEFGLEVLPHRGAATDTVATGGIRFLPLGWSPEWERGWGGHEGHSIGILAGYGTSGGYAGFCYEWLFHEMVGVVAEIVTPIFWHSDGHDIPRGVQLNVGMKFQFPGFGD